MDKQKAIEMIWQYMHLHHNLEKADAIIVLGSHDVRIGEYAAKLWLDGWAPYLVCSGSGTIHQHNPTWNDFIGSTEAEVFADIARKRGVPDEAILIENQSQNTGENYEFTIELLRKKNIVPTKIIAVQKPYMERRAYATGKVWLPDVEIIVTSPPLSLDQYPNNVVGTGDEWLHAMVGDLQRIKEYPAKGYQIQQDIPPEVWGAFEFLISEGYTKRLIKD